MKTWKDMMIETIRNNQYYEAGVLENMSEEEVTEIYNVLVDWLS